MTADIPDDRPRSVVAAKVFEVVQNSIKSPHPIAANPTATSDLKREVIDISRAPH
jgi:hypothetical protein